MSQDEPTIELGCYQGSEKHGFPLLQIVATLKQVLPVIVQPGKVA